LVFALTAINIDSEEGYHVLVSLIIHVVNLVALAKTIGQMIRWRAIHNSGRDDVGNVTVISIFDHVELAVAVEFPYGCELNVSAQYRNADIFLGG